MQGQCRPCLKPCGVQVSRTEKMAKENKYIGAGESRQLTLELYRDGELFGVWLDDNMGGSGIEVFGNTPEEAANNIADYVADYFYKQNN